MTEPAPTKAERNAAVAAVLADGVREGKIPWTDAARIIRADLRSRQTNKKLKIPYRSVEAQRVIDECHVRGEAPPKNGSDDALHADHVFPLTESDVMVTVTAEEWLALLEGIGLVVCVTASENYDLEKIEKSGVTGWKKYDEANVKVFDIRDGRPDPLSANGGES